MAKSEEEKYKGNEKVIKQLNTIKSIEEDIANTKKYAKTQNK